MIIMAIWNLQAAGRADLLTDSLASKATDATSKVLAAQSALAEQDFEASANAFSDAEQVLSEARAQLHEALAGARTVLEYIDITGKVRSSDNLLLAGSQLSLAGEHISRALAILLKESPDKVEENQNLLISLRQTKLELDQAASALIESEQALRQVDAAVVPTSIKNEVIRLKEIVPKLSQPISTLQKQHDAILSVLGANESQKYLLLLQNNNEQRATGGFIGTVGLINIDQGKIENIDINSVYDPDGQLKEYIAPPKPLEKINNRWFMRDANWFINFPESAAKVAQFFEKEGGPTVDGVIATNPEMLHQLLKITGPINVPGYNITVDATNFTDVTQREVTYEYDKALNKPKQFLADLTPLLLAAIVRESSNNPLKLISTLSQLIEEKNLLIFLRNEEIQRDIKAAGWDGSFPAAAQGFLHVNNTNIGGHKSDQFMEQEIDYRTSIDETGNAEVVLTIRRNHTGPGHDVSNIYPETENPAFKDNIVFQRVLVPRQAILVEAQGFNMEHQIPQTVINDGVLPLKKDPDILAWEKEQSMDSSGTIIGLEAGYKFFGNWILTTPGSTSVVMYRYRLPAHSDTPSIIDPASRYSVFVAKQPGDANTTLRTELTIPNYMQFVHTVPKSGITPSKANEIIYRGALDRDRSIGGVFTPL